MFIAKIAFCIATVGAAGYAALGSPPLPLPQPASIALSQYHPISSLAAAFRH